MGNTQVIDILEHRYHGKDADEIDQWYHEIHIPILFKSDKVRSIARYKVTGESSEFVRYFVICKYDSEQDFEEFLASQEFRDAGEGRPEKLSPEIHDVRPIHCELVREWVK